MGSYRQAIMSGFVCRLCSEQKNIVIHVYSKRAKTMGLLEKIKFSPIKIKKFDKLPKTICERCIEDVFKQYEIMQKIQKSMEIQLKHNMYHGNGNCSQSCPLYGSMAVPPRQRNVNASGGPSWEVIVMRPTTSSTEGIDGSDSSSLSSISESPIVLNENTEETLNT